MAQPLRLAIQIDADGRLASASIRQVDGSLRTLDTTAAKAGKAMAALGRNLAGLATAGGAAAAAGLGALVTGMANSAKEVENLARLSGTTPREFQRLAAAANSVGIEQEQLADIFKDTNDKVGEFLATGGGELKDFFELVAPRVGLTAEAFRGLSGPDALGLYVRALQDAGANQQEMTFFLEALANEASALTPLLRDGGAEMQRLGDRAEAAGAVMNESTLAAAKALRQTMTELGETAQGVGNQIGAELIPEINEFSDLLKDPETVQAAQALASGVIAAFDGIIAATRNVVNFTQWMGESIAAMRFGAAADDIVRLESELAKAEDMLASGPANRIRVFGPGGLVEYWSDDELKAEITRLKAAIAAYYDQPAILPPTVVTAPPPPPDTGDGIGLNLGGAAGAGAAGVDALSEALKALQQEQAAAAAGADYVAEVLLAGYSEADRAAVELAQAQQALNAALDAMQAPPELRQMANDALLAAEANKDLKKTGEEARDVGAAFGQAFSGAFESAIVGGRSFQDVLRGLLQDVITLILRMTVLKQLESSVSAGVNAVTSAITNALPFADGGVVSAAVPAGTYHSPTAFRMFADGGRVQAAVSPGIYSSPLAFPMPTPGLTAFASGGVGILGEAGPEAVVPLPDGRSIPVQMQGGGVQVNIIESASGGGEVKQREGAGGQQIIDVVVAKVRGEMMSDVARGGPFSAGLAKQFGLNRAAGGY